VLCGDAGRLIGETLLPETLSAVHIYFPDPWPKKRHEKRRLMNPPFVSALARVLAPDGRLCFATDHAETYERTVAMVRADGSFESLTAFTWSHERGITNFEQKYLREGRTSYRASFRRFSLMRDAERL
jgi:tRNA (guanine-N7-)-methyltransferase